MSPSLYSVTRPSFQPILNSLPRRLRPRRAIGFVRPMQAIQIDMREPELFRQPPGEPALARAGIADDEKAPRHRLRLPGARRQHEAPFAAEQCKLRLAGA